MNIQKLIMQTITIFFIGIFFLACNRDTAIDVKVKKEPVCIWLNNDIKHIMSRDGGFDLKDMQTAKIIKFNVDIEVSESQISEFNNITTEQKIKFLTNNETDFITNLLLYHIYSDEFNAHLWGIKEGEWRKNSKDKDVEFWTSFLAAPNSAK